MGSLADIPCGMSGSNHWAAHEGKVGIANGGQCPSGAISTAAAPGRGGQAVGPRIPAYPHH